MKRIVAASRIIVIDVVLLLIETKFLHAVDQRASGYV